MPQLFRSTLADRVWIRACGAVWALVWSLCWPVAVWAQAESATPAPMDFAAAAATAPLSGTLWSWRSADLALRLGFPEEAARLYGQVLEDARLPAGERQTLALQRITAWLSAGDLGSAEAALRAAAATGGSAYQLRLGLLAYQRRDLPGAREAYERVREPDLPAGDRAWWLFLGALLADARGDFPASQVLYAQAQAAAASPAQRAQFEVGQAQSKLLAGNSSEALANQLRRQVEEFSGRRVGFQFAQQYAVVLDLLGRKVEAISVLQRQLLLVPSDDAETRDSFLLLLGLVAGADADAGRNAFRRLLEGGQRREWQRVALQRLASAVESPGAADAFRALLDRLLSLPAPHPLVEDLLLARSRFLSNRGQYFEADADARALVERFPGSPLRLDALGLRASVAWQQRRYRTAAAVISQLRGESPAAARAGLTLLLAECSFRAGDFANAAEAYGESLRDPAPGASRGAVFYQQVVCEILARRLPQATELLDGASADLSLDAASRWRAEWNLLKALQAGGQVGQAFARLELLLGRAEALRLPADLRLRLLWLRASLSLDAGRASETGVFVDDLDAALAEGAAGGVDPATRARLSANGALLRAQADLAGGRAAEGRAALARLREAFPASEAAAFSFLVEARQLAAEGRLAEAEALLLGLADEYPESEYAAVALYESAAQAERRGLDASYEQALERLERLATRYPSHPLVFAARLRQGDLLRRRNRFEAAQQVYEALVNQFPEHPEADLARLSLADTLLAQANAERGGYDAGLSLLERLFDLPSTAADLRVEAGCKLASAMAGQGRGQRAAEIYWMTTALALQEEEAGRGLGATGRYWLGRTLLEVGAMMEAQARPDKAREAYGLVSRLRVPGEALAAARLARLSPP